MKTLLIIFFTLFFLTIKSQDFNGKYYSTETSFQDKENPANNFNAKAKIFVTINYKADAKSKNYITITDPETPKVIHKYLLTSKAEKMPASKHTTSSYLFKNSYNKSLGTNSDIVIYYNNKNELNVMLAGKDKSQALKGLVKMK
jgi:hypothetical protein